MDRVVLRAHWVSSLLVSMSALGTLFGCDDASDDSRDRAASQAGRRSLEDETGGTGSGGAGSKSDAAAQAGKSSTGGTPAAPGNESGAPGAEDRGGTSPNADPGPEAAGGDVGAGGEPACTPTPPALPTDVPAAIAAPAGVTLLRSLHAVGTQNYRCTATDGQAGADPTFAWVFVAPVADLFNSCGVKVGSHFAVPGSSPPAPEWKYEVDGSSVIGVKVDSAPVTGSIPELLLKENGHDGAGVFAAVTFVQRLQTVDGAAPAAASCDLAHVDAVEKVAYSAQYYFYSGGI